MLLSDALLCAGVPVASSGSHLDGIGVETQHELRSFHELRPAPIELIPPQHKLFFKPLRNPGGGWPVTGLNLESKHLQTTEPDCFNSPGVRVNDVELKIAHDEHLDM
jgi:hypothetical protein